MRTSFHALLCPHFFYLLRFIFCSVPPVEDNIARVDLNHDKLMQGKMEEFCSNAESGYYCMPHDVFHVLECPSGNKIKCLSGEICGAPMGIKLKSPQCEPLEIPDL